MASKTNRTTDDRLENLRLNSQNSMMMYFSVRYGVERINSL